MVYEVMSPLGEAVEKGKSISPRLPDLSGKTVCEVANGRFRVEVLFPVIRGLLRERYPDIKIIPYTEFPIQHVEGSGAELTERARKTAAMVVEKGGDAVITGNGF